MKSGVIAILFLFSQSATAQTGEEANGLYKIKKDSSGFELYTDGASLLANLPLKCLTQEFPNKTNHVSNSKNDHVLLPSELHPVFYGCFDWHSSVHGYWMLVRLLKQFPDLPEGDRIRKTIRENLMDDKIQQEILYFEQPNTTSWERTYGWAWLLKLDAELTNWDDEDGRQWKNTLAPLTEKIVQLWTNFLPKQTYANRTGVHPNTAFGLGMAFDYAESSGNKTFRQAIIKSATDLFLADKNAPAAWEPNGSDFLSPSLQEAYLMQRILPKTNFITWFNSFLSSNDIKHLTKIPVVSDRSDLQIVHLDGLSLSRSWCMMKLAEALPANDSRKKILMRSAITHLSVTLPHVVSGEYGGEHWLASFAVMALLPQ